MDWIFRVYNHSECGRLKPRSVFLNLNWIYQLNVTIFFSEQKPIDWIESVSNCLYCLLHDRHYANYSACKRKVKQSTAFFWISSTSRCANLNYIVFDSVECLHKNQMVKYFLRFIVFNKSIQHRISFAEIEATSL